MNKIRNIGPSLKAVDSLLYLTATFDGCCSSSDSLPLSDALVDSTPQFPFPVGFSPSYSMESGESIHSLIFQSRLVGRVVGGNARSR